MQLEINNSGQVMKVEKIGNAIIKTHYCNEYEHTYNVDGEIIETRKFNLQTGEYDIVE